MVNDCFKKESNAVFGVFLQRLYKDLKKDIRLKADLIIADKVIVQIKSVETIEIDHHKEIYTFLKFADKKVGLLINFNVCNITNGIMRFDNN